MDLTVLITCKDRVKNLRWCLQSIAQCNPRPELLLVDFGNEPPLEHLKKTYGDWLHIIRAVHNTKSFHKTRALNIGIKNIKTKYVCMTDSDQIFQPNFFGVVEHVLKNNPTAFVQCKTFFLRGLFDNVTSFDLTPALYHKMLEYAKNDDFKKPHGEGCCHGVTHEWLMTVNGHDEKYIGWGYEDKDLVLRATHCGRQILWIDHATSMVHIPHQRDMNYFGFEVRHKNELYYQAKLGNVLPIVNINCPWGEL
jgi:glycosyltransferase involved in cell wall biosynthesis